MSLVYLITHPDVVIDPDVPVPQWPLSARGKERMKKIDSQSGTPSARYHHNQHQFRLRNALVHLGAHQAIGLGNHFGYGNCGTWQELVPRPHGLAIRRNERCKF